MGMSVIARTGDSTDLEHALLEEYAAKGNLDIIIPRLARDDRAMRRIEAAARHRETSHELVLGDARSAAKLQPGSVHLVVTSPPYWTLKRYNECEDQLGHVAEYDEFIAGLDKVWKHCFDALVPGGRMIVNVGDVCLSRRKNNGRHTVVPLHATIQEHCKGIGFDNLAPIIWHKISNAKYEVEGNGGFLGKPYEPNAVIKNDIEFVLMQRKPGGYRSPSRLERFLSIVPANLYQVWFKQIWSDITGASTAKHPAPFPEQLAERLIRMFSFVGDTVLDPFMGTATTNYVAGRWGRNSIGIEVDPEYYIAAQKRMAMFSTELFGSAAVGARTFHEDDRGGT
jgi:DNA modification methylase